MGKEEWIVGAKLSGDFFITDERSSSGVPPVDGLRRLSITPEEDEQGKWTGLHELEGILLLENDTNAPLESHVVHENAQHLVNTVTMIASLWIGRPVGVSGGIHAKRRISDEEPLYRFITRAVESFNRAPRAPLPAAALGMSIEPGIGRVIRWWARGLAATDGVDRLIALNNALDLLAGMEDDVPGRVRRCKSCGAEQNIGPGLRERVIHFLSAVLEHPENTAIDIYEIRIDLAHARSDLTEPEMRRYREQALLLADAVRSGIARALAITLPPTPRALPVDLPSSLLDLQYVEGDKGARQPRRSRSLVRVWKRLSTALGCLRRRVTGLFGVVRGRNR